MQFGFIVRMRATSPWRLGPSSGAKDRVDRLLHSDTLYSALTIAARDLGILEEWIAATAASKDPQVRLGSAYPFTGRTLLAPAPKHVWPPTATGRLRWKSARFVPLQLVPRLLAYETLKDDRWAVDPVSQSVLPVEKFGEVTPPFKVSYRRTAAVDRVTGTSQEAEEVACLEFTEGSGLWCPVSCDEAWTDRVKALFRLSADAGFGGKRSLGWGRSAMTEFEPLPSILTANVTATEHHEIGYWMLSLFAPAPSDQVDWARGSYTLLRRSGRTYGGGRLKAESAMVEEGSVLIAAASPVGLALDVAAPEAGQAVYRNGVGISVSVLVRLPSYQALQKPAAPGPVAAVELPAAEPVGDVAAEHETIHDPPVEDSASLPTEIAPEFVSTETPAVEDFPAATDVENDSAREPEKPEEPA